MLSRSRRLSPSARAAGLMRSFDFLLLAFCPIRFEMIPALHLFAKIQVKYILFFKSKEGAAKFIGSSESLLFTAMELNRYRQVVYLPDATQAQDSSVIKRRYLQMASMDRVPLKVVHEDAAGESYDYAAMFLQKSLWLEGILPKISISIPSHQLPRIIIPLKGKAVTFSDDTNTDLLISHNDKVITLRFINVVERDAFAFLYAIIFCSLHVQF